MKNKTLSAILRSQTLKRGLTDSLINCQKIAFDHLDYCNLSTSYIKTLYTSSRYLFVHKIKLIYSL